MPLKCKGLFTIFSPATSFRYTGLNAAASPGSFTKRACTMFYQGKRVSLRAMNLKERAFVNEYIINGGNAYQAAMKAGYAKTTAVHAYQWLEDETKINQSRRLPYKPYLRESIDNRLKEIEDAKIADATEVMQYLTSVVRKESRSEVVVVEGIGEGCSEARLVEKPPDEREALDAAKTLAKIYGLEKNNLSMNADMNLNISIDYGDDD